MAKKITYLLGAGASANALPVVKNMNARMGEIVSFLESKKKINLMKECRNYYQKN